MCALRPNASMMTSTAGAGPSPVGRARKAGNAPADVGTSIISMRRHIGNLPPPFQWRSGERRCYGVDGFASGVVQASTIARISLSWTDRPTAVDSPGGAEYLKPPFCEDMRREKSNYIIQSVSHSLDVLEQFFGEADELGVTELSKRLKLHKNNVFRLLATLESRGYIEQNRATENYRLGIRCLQLGQNYVQHMGLLRQARPIMTDLVRQVRETTYLAVLRRVAVVPVEVIEADRPVRIVSQLGEALPLHCTAAGKAYLAFESEDDVRALLPDGLPRLTERTIVDRQALVQQLRTVVATGYAVDLGEHLEDVRAVAAPVRDYARAVVGALAVVAPASRLTPERIEKEVAPRVLKAGRELSSRPGCDVGRREAQA